MALRDLTLMFLVCLAWAAQTVISKIVVSDMEVPPLFLTATRFGIVALLALPWLLPIPRPTGRVLLVGILIGGGGFALFFLGLQTASPSSAAIVMQLGLPITTLLSVVMLGERINWRRGFGIVLTFGGGVLVMWDPGSGFPISAGLALILGSAAAGSLGAVMMKQVEGVRPLQFQAWVALASAPPLAILSFLLEPDPITPAIHAGWPFIAALLYSALIVSLIGHTIYYSLIGKYPANLIAPLTIMNPLMTVTLGIVVTGDQFDTKTAVGTAIALCGVLIIALRRNHVMPLAALVWDRFR